MLQLTMNGQNVHAMDGDTILDAATRNHIRIPTLCHLDGVHNAGACRICSVEVEGAKGLMASCMTPVKEGMVVRTNTARVRRARRVLYELILSDHPSDCLHCDRNGSCELQDTGEILQVRESRYEGLRAPSSVDGSNPSIVRDTDKCILCRRCVTMCNEIQSVGAIQPQYRGFLTRIGTGGELPLESAVCTYCGQCTTVCPVDALKEADATREVWDELDHSDRVVMVQTAPAVRAALGEEFGMPPGTLVTGKMVRALRNLGFTYVFDTNFTADLTIMEEGYELLARLVGSLARQGVIGEREIEGLGLQMELPEPVLPMITSCSPGWIKYAEHFYSDLLPHLSSCKSPHMMLGALAKTWFAQTSGMTADQIYMVSVMPCTAKKYEITRPEMMRDGIRDVDAVLTTRELARMIREAGIDFEALEDDAFDAPLGLSTGAADIFGTTGGVMEAALRTVHAVITGRPVPDEQMHIRPLAGLDRVKEAALTFTDVLPAWSFLEGVTVRMAVTSGLTGAAQLMDGVRDGESPYLFIEVMGCPGGCLSGGGQPRPVTDEIRMKRMDAIYREDEGKPMRMSHENPDVTELYDRFLKYPGSPVSHHLLHTTYTVRPRV